MTTRLFPQHGRVPRAEPSATTARFWEACRRRELLFQRCDACGSANFVPTERCRVCTAAALTWERSVGRGSLYSWSVVWRPVTPAFEVPYAVAIVDLDEGYQMMTNLIDCDVEDIRAGMAVEVDFRDVDDTLTLPYFRPRSWSS